MQGLKEKLVAAESEFDAARRALKAAAERSTALHRQYDAALVAIRTKRDEALRGLESRRRNTTDYRLNDELKAKEMQVARESDGMLRELEAKFKGRLSAASTNVVNATNQLRPARDRVEELRDELKYQLEAPARIMPQLNEILT